MTVLEVECYSAPRHTSVSTHAFTLNWYAGSFLPLVWMDLVNGEAICFGPYFVLVVFFFYGKSAVKFDITCTLPVLLNIRRCARNFVRFFLAYGAPPPF